MTSHELVEWAAFEQVHGPILVQERLDAYWLLTLKLLSRTRRAKLKDFFPPWLTRTRPQSPAALEATLQSWVVRGADANH